MQNKKDALSTKVGMLMRDNSMIFIFLGLALLTTITSGQSLTVSLNDFIIRFFRNFLLVVALILPINAGIGLNFGIVLGALGSQVALVMVLAMGAYQTNVGSMLLWTLLTIVICIICGYLLGLLFNATKGQEMISGLFVGFLATGVYMFILMVVLGGIIKIGDSALVSQYGAPIKVTINLPATMYQGFDNMISLPFTYLIVISYIVALAYCTVKIIQSIRTKEKGHAMVVGAGTIALTVVFLFVMLYQPAYTMFARFKLPVVTFLLSVLVAVITWWLGQTKLGHDFLSIKNDMGIAASVGICVDRTRMIAIILSTVFAGLGQLVYIQNMGTLRTYGMQNTVATFAIAAILIGGATIKKANMKNAVFGTILFHIIYSTAPNAAKNVFGNIQIGEYFRVFMCYGVIAVAIVMFAVQEAQNARRKLKLVE